MSKEVGLWIDHRKVVIVTIENDEEMILEIKSNLEKHVRFSSGTSSKASNKPQGSTAEDVRDRQYGDHVEKFFKAVIPFLRDADSIWIFGPGEAKIEFETQLKHENLGDHIVGVETVDKMTNPQIAAKVRDRFLR
jgi:hypothetical protein